MTKSGNTLRSWRMKSGLTQQQAAEALGITQATLSRLETGVRSYNRIDLESIAELYGCRPAQLLEEPGVVRSEELVGEPEPNLAARLRQARTRSGFASAKDAAKAAGIPVATYIQHENGTRGVPVTRAAMYAAQFGVSKEWLLFGKTDPSRGLTGDLIAVFEQLPEQLKREALAYLRGLLAGSLADVGRS